jgi:hypothetical protein
MRRSILLVLTFGMMLSLISLAPTAPTKAQDAEGTPCLDSTLSSTPDGTATLEGDAGETVSYVGTISQAANGDIILTTVDGDEIVVAPSGAFAPGQLDLSLTYEITGTETEDGTLKAEAIVVVEVATATPDATLEATLEATQDGTPSATLEPTAAATSDPCESTSATGGKVTVCHLPGGDINKARTLTIGAPALPAHLGHGDYPGPCAKEGKRGKSDNKGQGNGNGKGGGKGKP